MPLVPILSVLASFYLMLNLTADTWVRFFVWMASAWSSTSLYGHRHSRLRTEDQPTSTCASGSDRRAAARR